MEENEWWSLKYPWKDSVGFLPHFTGRTKSSTIKEIEDAYGDPWSKLRRQGFKLVKIKFVEITPTNTDGE